MLQHWSTLQLLDDTWNFVPPLLDWYSTVGDSHLHWDHLNYAMPPLDSTDWVTCFRTDLHRTDHERDVSNLHSTDRLPVVDDARRDIPVSVSVSNRLWSLVVSTIDAIASLPTVCHVSAPVQDGNTKCRLNRNSGDLPRQENICMSTPAYRLGPESLRDLPRQENTCISTWGLSRNVYVIWDLKPFPKSHLRPTPNPTSSPNQNQSQIKINPNHSFNLNHN